MVTTKYRDKVDTQYVDLNVCDNRDRKIGAIIITTLVAFETAADDDGKLHYHKLQPGIYYAVEVRTTKNNVPFGIGETEKFFKTENEREKYITRRLKLIRGKYA